MMKINFYELISEIEQILNIKLFKWEKEYLKTILKARQNSSKVIINRARHCHHCYARADAILIALTKFQGKLEKEVLTGDSSPLPKGMLSDVRNNKKFYTAKEWRS